MWSLNTLSATVGVQVLTQLAALAGEPLAALTKGASGADIMAIDIDVERMAGALSALAVRLAGDGTVDTIKTLLRSLCKKTGRGFSQVDFDDEFAGNYGVLAEVVGQAIKLNYSSFFSGSAVARGLAAAHRMATMTSQTPPTSIGDSGVR